MKRHTGFHRLNRALLQLSRYYAINIANLDNIFVRPTQDWHGKLNGRIYTTFKFQEDLPPQPTGLSFRDFFFDIVALAVADMPIVTISTQTVFVRENSAVKLSLSAFIADLNFASGSETILLTMYNVPEDSIFNDSAPVQNGNACPFNSHFTFNQNVTFTPPPFWSENITLELLRLTQLNTTVPAHLVQLEMMIVYTLLIVTKYYIHFLFILVNIDNIVSYKCSRMTLPLNIHIYQLPRPEGVWSGERLS
jgi:hypothetical protein